MWTSAPLLLESAHIYTLGNHKNINYKLDINNKL